jgi:hypothetical protein
MKLTGLVMAFVLFFVNVIFIRFLWNNSLVKHVTILRPTTTIVETILLALALTLLTAPNFISGFTDGFVGGFAKGVKNAL